MEFDAVEIAILLSFHLLHFMTYTLQYTSFSLSDFDEIKSWDIYIWPPPPAPLFRRDKHRPKKNSGRFFLHFSVTKNALLADWLQRLALVSCQFCFHFLNLLVYLLTSEGVQPWASRRGFQSHLVQTRVKSS